MFPCSNSALGLVGHRSDKSRARTVTTTVTVALRHTPGESCHSAQPGLA